LAGPAFTKTIATPTCCTCFGEESPGTQKAAALVT
jgi:hypothetical protein